MPAESIESLTGLTRFFLGVVGVFFAVGVAWYWIATERVLRALRAARTELAKRTAEFVSLDVPARGLGPAWTEFAQDAHRSEEGGAGVAPEDYFTEHELLPKWLPSFASSLPGILTGVGIMGTFFGIVLGLPNGAGLASEALMDDVLVLLGGMRTAFWSSIAGIGTSLLFLIFHNGRRANVRVKLARFHRFLRSRFSLATPDAHLAQSVVLLKRNQLILQDLGTNLTAAIENAVRRGMAPAVETLTTSIGNLTEEVSNNQIDAIGELVEEFRTQLSGVVQEEFSVLADRISSAAESQERITTVLSEFFGTLEGVAETQVDLLEASTRAAEEFKSGIEGLDRVHRLIKESGERLESVSTALAEATVTVADDVELLTSANEALREVLATQLDSVQGQVESLQSFWTDFSSSLHGFRESLEETLRNLNSDVAAGIRQVLEGFDAEMSRVVEHLGGTLAELREVTEGLPGNVERFRETVERVDGHAGTLVERLEWHRDGIDASTRALQQLPGALEGLLAETSTAGNGEKRGRPESVAMRSPGDRVSDEPPSLADDRRPK